MRLCLDAGVRTGQVNMLFRKELHDTDECARCNSEAVHDVTVRMQRTVFVLGDIR